MTSPLRGVRLCALDLDGTLLPSSKSPHRPRDRRRPRPARRRHRGDARDRQGLEPHAPLRGRTRHQGPGRGARRRARRGAGGAVGASLHRRTLPTATLRAVHEATDRFDVGFFYCHDGWRTRVHRRLERWLPQIRIWDPHVDLTDAAPHGNERRRPRGVRVHADRSAAAPSRRRASASRRSDSPTSTSSTRSSGTATTSSTSAPQAWTSGPASSTCSRTSAWRRPRCSRAATGGTTSACSAWRRRRGAGQRRQRRARRRGPRAAGDLRGRRRRSVPRGCAAAPLTRVR